jgi:hypothetical protein
MYGQFAFDFINGHGHVLTFRFERFDDNWFAIKNGRVNPAVATVGQIFHVGQLSPLHIELGTSDGYFFGTLVDNGIDFSIGTRMFRFGYHGIIMIVTVCNSVPRSTQVVPDVSSLCH